MYLKTKVVHKLKNKASSAWRGDPADFLVQLSGPGLTMGSTGRQHMWETQVQFSPFAYQNN
jgi:hypothetical protein